MQFISVQVYILPKPIRNIRAQLKRIVVTEGCVGVPKWHLDYY